eukprot:8653645-Ditylum_brightwellii.AAC.1
MDVMMHKAVKLLDSGADARLAQMFLGIPGDVHDTHCMDWTTVEIPKVMQKLKEQNHGFGHLDQVKELCSNAEDTSARVEEAVQKVKDVEEEHYGPFHEKTGLQDFQAYHEAVGKARKEFLKKRKKIHEHLDKLVSKQDYKIRRDFKMLIAKADKHLENHKMTL